MFSTDSNEYEFRKVGRFLVMPYIYNTELKYSYCNIILVYNFAMFVFGYMTTEHM